MGQYRTKKRGKAIHKRPRDPKWVHWTFLDISIVLQNDMSMFLNVNEFVGYWPKLCPWGKTQKCSLYVSSTKSSRSRKNDPFSSNGKVSVLVLTNHEKNFSLKKHKKRLFHSLRKYWLQYYYTRGAKLSLCFCIIWMYCNNIVRSQHVSKALMPNETLWRVIIPT